MLNEVKSRLLNVHTVNGIGIAAAATGVVAADKVGAISTVVNGNPTLTLIGLALVVLSKVFRKA